jgi:hypothetical protein
VDEVKVEAAIAERVARNDATFRAANERIRAAAEALDTTIRLVPFICECADERCVDVVRLELGEYREIRSNPRWFVNVPGHETAARGWVEVVATRDGYVIVEKVGRAGEVVEELAAGDLGGPDPG